MKILNEKIFYVYLKLFLILFLPQKIIPQFSFFFWRQIYVQPIWIYFYTYLRVAITDCNHKQLPPMSIYFYLSEIIYTFARDDSDLREKKIFFFKSSFKKNK